MSNTKRKRNLSDVLHKASGKVIKETSFTNDSHDDDSSIIQMPEKTTVDKNEKKSKGSYVAPSRIGKKSIASQFDPAVSKQLKKLAIDKETTLQKLLAEAINDLFEKHNMAPIA